MLGLSSSVLVLYKVKKYIESFGCLHFGNKIKSLNLICTRWIFWFWCHYKDPKQRSPVKVNNIWIGNLTMSLVPILVFNSTITTTLACFFDRTSNFLEADLKIDWQVPPVNKVLQKFAGAKFAHQIICHMSLQLLDEIHDGDVVGVKSIRIA